MINKFRETAERWEGYDLTWRCNEECHITKEEFKKIFDEEMQEFDKKFSYFSDKFIKKREIKFGLYFRDAEPIKEHIYGICYIESGIIKIFKQNICTHNNHKITKEFKGQVFNIILHESLHTIFGGDEKTITLITHRIGKYEGKEYDKTVKVMKND